MERQQRESEDASAARRHWKRAALGVRSMTRFRLLPSWHQSDAETGIPIAAKLGAYERLGVLGVGGAAVVYLVRHRASQLLFAMKVQSCPMQQPWPRRTFHARKEQYILQMLQHPFVCRLHEAFHDDKRLYLVLEYHAGGSLADIQQFCGGTLSEQAVKVYASEIVHALEYVHTMGFVYRDLKPQNVLIGMDGHIRLTDFGVAHEGVPVDPSRYYSLDEASEWDWNLEHPKSASNEDDRTTTTAATTSSCGDDLAPSEQEIDVPDVDDGRSTTEDEWDVQPTDEASTRFQGIDDRVRLRSNSFVGTPEYMPPEMIQQASNQSSDVDWWALGCLLYELLYGASPFRRAGETSSKPLFRRILVGKLEFPMFPRTSASSKDLIRRLLSVDSRERIGHRHGSAEIKAHSFFHGLSWAYRSCEPPVHVHSRCPSCLKRGIESQVPAPFVDSGEIDQDDVEWCRWNQVSADESRSCLTKCGHQYKRPAAPASCLHAFVRSQSERFSSFRRQNAIRLARSDSFL